MRILTIPGGAGARRGASPEQFHDREKSGNALDQRRIIKGLAVLLLLTAAIVVAGKWLIGFSVSALHSQDTTIYEIAIGDDVVAAPANMIRFEEARRDGNAERLELYFHWPEMTGYTAATRDDFNHAGGSRRILFGTFEQRSMPDDMSGRFDKVYRELIDGKGTPVAGGVVLYDFKPDSGYVNEVLAVAQSKDREPFVARCLTGPEGEAALAPCERDIHVGDGLSLTFRFPRELLPGWRSLDAAIHARVSELVVSAD